MMQIVTLLGIPKVLFLRKSLVGVLICVGCSMICIGRSVGNTITGFAVAVQ